MEWVYLLTATFFASVVQSATGFGFGLIAVPLFLIVLNSTDAIQIVIIVSLIISSIHWLKLRNMTPVFLLKWLVVGCMLGFPLGLILFTQLELDALKMLIGVLIILISLQNGWYLIRSRKADQSTADQNANPLALTGIGITSGLMAISIAMPGPPLMLYLTRTTLDKNQVRAAMFAFIMFSYSGSLIVQSLFIGVDQNTWETAVILIPIAIAGMFLGHQLSNKISEDYFKALVLVILLLTGCVMLLNL